MLSGSAWACSRRRATVLSLALPPLHRGTLIPSLTFDSGCDGRTQVPHAMYASALSSKLFDVKPLAYLPTLANLVPVPCPPEELSATTLLWPPVGSWRCMDQKSQVCERRDILSRQSVQLGAVVLLGKCQEHQRFERQAHARTLASGPKLGRPRHTDITSNLQLTGTIAFAPTGISLFPRLRS